MSVAPACTGAAAAVALWACAVYRGRVRRAREAVGAGAAPAAMPWVAPEAPIGDYFGMDIGGTLTKIVFFSPDSEELGSAPDDDDGGMGGGGGGGGGGGLRGRPGGGGGDGCDGSAPAEARDVEARRRASLAAVAAFLARSRTYGATGVRDDVLAFHSAPLRGTFHFIRCETRALPAAMALVEGGGSWHREIKEMCATGGGAQKYAGMVRERLGVTLVPGDELGCLVRGMSFLLAAAPEECYVVAKRTAVPRPLPGGGDGGGDEGDGGGGGATDGGGISSGIAAACFPYLVVNVGSGVSIMLVSSDREWRRVSGSSIGGGTYYGLCHLLTGLTSFHEMLAQSESGDNVAVDLTVGDIYGGARSFLGCILCRGWGAGVRGMCVRGGGGGGGGVP